MNEAESLLAEPFEAEAIINSIIEAKTGGGQDASVDEISSGVKRASALLSAEEQTKTNQYIVGLQKFHHGTVITTLDDGIGGLYDGSNRMVAADCLFVDRSIEYSLAESQEADGHEWVHAQGKHTNPYKTYNGGQGSSTFLVLGSVPFTHKAFIEGYTVYKRSKKNPTGLRFVSDEYKHFRTLYISALQNAEVSEAEVETAINTTHNLVAIDDRADQALAA